jgi:hypothetical protein
MLPALWDADHETTMPSPIHACVGPFCRRLVRLNPRPSHLAEAGPTAPSPGGAGRRYVDAIRLEAPVTRDIRPLGSSLCRQR